MANLTLTECCHITFNECQQLTELLREAEEKGTDTYSLIERLNMAQSVNHYLTQFHNLLNTYKQLHPEPTKQD